jgi:hypothetical protein
VMSFDCFANGGSHNALTQSPINLKDNIHICNI